MGQVNLQELKASLSHIVDVATQWMVEVDKALAAELDTPSEVPEGADEGADAGNAVPGGPTQTNVLEEAQDQGADAPAGGVATANAPLPEGSDGQVLDAPDASPGQTA